MVTQSAFSRRASNSVSGDLSHSTTEEFLPLISTKEFPIELEEKRSLMLEEEKEDDDAIVVASAAGSPLEVLRVAKYRSQPNGHAHL